MPKAQNPFDVDDDEKPGEPVEEKTAVEVPEGAEIPVDKDEDDDDPTDDAPTRAKKRAERGRALARELREAKEREAALESAKQAAEQRAQQNEAYAREAYARAQQAQQPQVDPLDQHERAARKEIEDLMELSTALQDKGALTPEKAKELKDRYFAASQRMNEVAAARVQRWNAWQASQHAQQQPTVQAQAEYAALQMRLRAEFPDVVDHPQAWPYANAEWAKIIHLKRGDPRDWKIVQEAMATTRRAFRLGNAPAPSDATKRRYAGVGSGGGAPPTNGKRTVAMGREFKMMAHARYPKLSPDDAEKKWAQTVGKSMADEEDS